MTEAIKKQVLLSQ